MKQEVYLMKKRMTAFLMMMILAVSVAAAALSDPAPAYCSHNNTYTEDHTDRYCIDANRHHIHTVIFVRAALPGIAAQSGEAVAAVDIIGAYFLSAVRTVHVASIVHSEYNSHGRN